MQEPPITSPLSHLLGLPWHRWATRLAHGVVRLEGRLVSGLEIDAGELPPGPVAVSVWFSGSPQPHLTRGDVRARGILAPVGGPELALVLSQLWDVGMHASCTARTDLDLEVPGLHLRVPAGTPLTATGAAAGPPDALVLSGPLSLYAGEAHLRLDGGGRHLRWLSSLAAMRLERVVLHPDGRVALEGGARRGLDRAVRSGLAHAGMQLSELVQRSPRFDRLRSFLQP